MIVNVHNIHIVCLGLQNYQNFICSSFGPVHLTRCSNYLANQVRVLVNKCLSINYNYDDTKYCEFE